MDVLALYQPGNEVCCRYRIAAHAPAFAASGLRLRLEPLADTVLGRLRQFQAARRFDWVILQRKLLVGWQRTWLRRCARRLAFDFDDAVYCRDSFHPRGAESWLRARRFRAVVRQADLVLAGNAELVRAARAGAPRGPVCLAPTCVEPEQYPAARHERRGRDARLVWIGQCGTLSVLCRGAAHLAAVAAAVPGLELRLVCDATAELTGLRTVLRRWSSATEAAELAAADIGISWLPDDPFSRGKCGLKVLQYMAAGLPVVATPVGMHRAVVVPGQTGFLAETPAEWAAAVRRLAGDPELRARMGRAGRALVQRHFSTAVWGPRIAAALAGLAVAERPHNWPAGTPAVAAREAA